MLTCPPGGVPRFLPRPVPAALHRSKVAVLQPEARSLAERLVGFGVQRGFLPWRQSDHCFSTRASGRRRCIARNPRAEAQASILSVQQPELPAAVLAEVPRHEITMYRSPMRWRIRRPLDDSPQRTRGIGRYLSDALQVRPSRLMKFGQQLVPAGVHPVVGPGEQWRIERNGNSPTERIYEDAPGEARMESLDSCGLPRGNAQTRVSPPRTP
jgi:hypothetical protein